ncbi:hypothetical protein VXL47_12065 [Phaeobacter sp. JH20_30]|uniref:hypothetical protein n=1 Tax=unclassified Phaeobacter TaxID=2621772 RepID=UPI003A88C5BF
MRRSMLGDYYATSTEEDLIDAFVARDVEADDCFADITFDEDGGYCVEIRENESGEQVVATDDGLFETADAARFWASKWVSQVNDNF